MTRIEALQAIHASIARGSGTPTLREDGDRVAYLADVVRDLEQGLIEPAPAVVRGVVHEYGLLDLLSRNSCCVLAQKQERCLGFVAATGDFFLAWGTDLDNLEALGFHSDDALAEWLG